MIDKIHAGLCFSLHATEQSSKLPSNLRDTSIIISLWLGQISQVGTLISDDKGLCATAP